MESADDLARGQGAPRDGVSRTAGTVRRSRASLPRSRAQRRGGRDGGDRRGAGAGAGAPSGGVGSPVAAAGAAADSASTSALLSAGASTTASSARAAPPGTTGSAPLPTSLIVPLRPRSSSLIRRRRVIRRGEPAGRLKPRSRSALASASRLTPPGALASSSRTRPMISSCGAVCGSCDTGGATGMRGGSGARRSPP